MDPAVLLQKLNTIIENQKRIITILKHSNPEQLELLNTMEQSLTLPAHTNTTNTNIPCSVELRSLLTEFAKTSREGIQGGNRNAKSICRMAKDMHMCHVAKRVDGIDCIRSCSRAPNKEASIRNSQIAKQKAIECNIRYAESIALKD